MTSEVELDTYRDAAISLETKAKTLEEHLSAIATLLPEVRKEARQLQRSPSTQGAQSESLNEYSRQGHTPQAPSNKPQAPNNEKIENFTMQNTLLDTTSTAFDKAVVASYSDHSEAETAVRSLAAGGLPINQVSIIGRNFETHEDIQGFYRPADAALEGAQQGAWFGGFFGLMLGAMGFFVFPIVGGLLIAGPLAGLVAGAISGAGVGALVNGLVASGIPREQALKYQERLQAGEFLVVLHGSEDETARAHEILDDALPTYLQTHPMTPEDPTAYPESE